MRYSQDREKKGLFFFFKEKDKQIWVLILYKKKVEILENI